MLNLYKKYPLKMFRKYVKEWNASGSRKSFFYYLNELAGKDRLRNKVFSTYADNSEDRPNNFSMKKRYQFGELLGYFYKQEQLAKENGTSITFDEFLDTIDYDDLTFSRQEFVDYCNIHKHF